MKKNKIALILVMFLVTAVAPIYGEDRRLIDDIHTETDQSVICSALTHFEQLEQNSLFLGLTAPFYSSSGTSIALNTEDLDTEESQFLILINQYRNENGLPSLQENALMSSASQWMSQDMAYHNYVSHTDSMGRDPYQRMVSRGYYPSVWGENIAAGISKAKGAFKAWKNSPGHNANMLSPRFRSIGIGRAYSPYSTYKWYWTTDFGDQ